MSPMLQSPAMLDEPGFASTEKINLVENVFDISGSTGFPMADDSKRTKIEGLTFSLGLLKQSVLKKPILRSSTRVGLTTFGGTVKVHPFVPVDAWQPPNLHAKGGTPMGEALSQALDAIQQEVQRINDEGNIANAPVMVLYTDGGANGDAKILADAISRLQNLTNRPRPKLVLITAGADECDVACLDAMGFGVNARLIRTEADFEELMQFVSMSLVSVAKGQKQL